MPIELRKTFFVLICLLPHIIAEMRLDAVKQSFLNCAGICKGEEYFKHAIFGMIMKAYIPDTGGCK
jgi:hypothetical protein